MNKHIAIAIIRGLHNFILLFVVFGWAIPYSSIRLVHIIIIPMMIIQWWLNHGTCVLTNIENKIYGANAPKAEQESQFLRSMLAKVTSWKPTKKQMGYLIYGITLTSWFASLLLYFRTNV